MYYSVCLLLDSRHINSYLPVYTQHERMDIVPVRVNVCLSESEDSEGEMAYKEAQIQGDYSGYVPPEVVVTDTATVSPRRASAPVTKPSQKVSLSEHNTPYNVVRTCSMCTDIVSNS